MCRLMNSILSMLWTVGLLLGSWESISFTRPERSELNWPAGSGGSFPCTIFTMRALRLRAVKACFRVAIS